MEKLINKLLYRIKYIQNDLFELKNVIDVFKIDGGIGENEHETYLRNSINKRMKEFKNFVNENIKENCNVKI